MKMSTQPVLGISQTNFPVKLAVQASWPPCEIGAVLWK